MWILVLLLVSNVTFAEHNPGSRDGLPPGWAARGWGKVERIPQSEEPRRESAPSTKAPAPVMTVAAFCENPVRNFLRLCELGFSGLKAEGTLDSYAAGTCSIAADKEVTRRNNLTGGIRVLPSGRQTAGVPTTQKWTGCMSELQQRLNREAMDYRYKVQSKLSSRPF